MHGSNVHEMIAKQLGNVCYTKHNIQFLLSKGFVLILIILISQQRIWELKVTRESLEHYSIKKNKNRNTI